jgi:Carbohydrate binding domain (family 11)
MGETVPAEPPPTLRVGGRVPARARVSLLRDGRPVREGERGLELKAAAPGVYRAEARVPGWDVPWVVTNPIYVFDAATQEARARRAAWPPEPVAPAAVSVLDDFEGTTVFAPEFDPSSSVEPGILAKGAGLGGKTAARLAFRLGAPGPGRPYTWCALVNREARDLSGRTGLVFGIKADGVYRVWVQVRDQNPASADEGTEWWFASVRTSTDWRRVALPFARFRSINKRTDGRLDLDKVSQVVFVLDPAAVKAGTSGTIWLDDIGVY